MEYNYHTVLCRKDQVVSLQYFPDNVRFTSTNVQIPQERNDDEHLHSTDAASSTYIWTYTLLSPL